MRPVTGGTQKLTMDSAERDYQQKLKQAQAQGDGNPFVAGIQEVFDMGAGAAAKNTRTKYGNVNIMPQELLEGAETNFAQKDAPSNAPMADAINQTGVLDFGTSNTRNANKDHDQVATEELDKRLQMYAQAGSNADFGNNNRAQTMRLG